MEGFLQGVEEALPGLPDPETQEDKVEKEDDRKAVACLAEPVVEDEEKPIPLRARLPPDATGYVVSISARIKVRRLHKLHACYRVPGIDYHDWELMGDEPPDPSSYDCACSQCFGKGAAVPLPQVEDIKNNSDYEDSGSSGSSSEGGE